MKKNSLFSFRYLVFDFVKITAIPGILWFRLKRLYENGAARKKQKKGVLFISNHVAFSDPVVLLFTVWYRRLRFICLKQFFEGAARFWFRSFLCIPIDKENVGLDSIRGIADHLKNEEAVVMFPEGQVNPSGEMSPFKSGMVLMALQGKVPIVPLYIQKKKHWYSRTRVVIGEAIEVSPPDGRRPRFSEIEAIAARLQEKEETLKKLAER